VAIPQKDFSLAKILVTSELSNEIFCASRSITISDCSITVSRSYSIHMLIMLQNCIKMLAYCPIGFPHQYSQNYFGIIPTPLVVFCMSNSI